MEALTDLSTFFVSNNLQTRRNLRSQIEQRSLTINENFLLSFKEVKNSLDAICNDIADMNKTVQAMQNCLQETQAQTKELIEQTNSLQDEREKLQVRQEVTSAFLSKFRLSVEDHQHLYGSNRDAPITMHFFGVLDRIHTIRSNCRILMQSGCQTAASDIMEEMTLHQEAALERLYRFTQSHCRNVDSDISEILQMAMNRLQDRPVLFKYVIDEYGNARRAIFVRNFIDALTVGGPNGNPKPIEMHSHDPKRYIGDMLAWLHQSIPFEKENISLLLKDCDKNDWSEQIQTAVAYIVDGICHAIKVRVETILNTCKDLIILYSVSNLLRFYQAILKQMIQGGEFEECLINLHAYSEMTYLKELSALVKTHLQRPNGASVEPPSNDLVPSSSVTKLLRILKEILSVASMVESRQTDITKIVSCVIDPLLQSITESASHLPTVDMAVYMLNCLYHMQTTLGMFEYVDNRMERLQGQSDAQIDTLTSEQASSLVANLNLGPIYTLLQTSTESIDPNHLKMFVVS